MNTDITNVFTADEWKVLVDTPMKAGQAMMLASPSNIIGDTLEKMKLSSSIKELIDKNSSNPLMRALGERMPARREEIMPSEGTGVPGSKDPAAARVEAIESCQQATTILNKVSPNDATMYKQYVLSVAQRVAGAAGEEGFLGLHGKKVSDAEQTLYNDLAKALGTTL